MPIELGIAIGGQAKKVEYGIVDRFWLGKEVAAIHDMNIRPAE
jgi:hypothetical protein